MNRSLARMTDCLENQLFPALERHGIRILGYDRLDSATKRTMRRYFDERVFPVLTPLAIDKSHPFPYISNLSLSLAVELDEPGRPRLTAPVLARVKVPGSLPRFVPLDAPAGQRWFVMIEDLIAHNLEALFPGMRVKAAYTFRVTRDADLDLQEDEADDLLQAIESELRRRRFGEPVRLEIEAGMPDALRDKLLEALELDPADSFAIDGMMGTSELWTLVNIDEPALHDPPFTPSIPKRLHGQTDMFAVIREGDVLLHHPYESFDPVVQFVQQAANDPDVLAIKQTLYRTSGNSPVIAALLEAAENGTQVAALIELKARFDEENNIHWARQLERVGAHVIYGLPNLKTHAKVTLIVRNEPDGIRRYMHFGTGNYNDKTARVYTDLSLFTCRADLGSDATQLFNALTGFSKADTYEQLMVAPTSLRSGLRGADRPRDRARPGRPAERDRGQAQRDQRRRDRAAALRRLARGRADRPDRARHVRAAPRHSRGERDDPGAQHRRAVSRALAHVRVRQRRRARGLHGQRGPDGPQPRPPRRDRRAGARPGAVRRDLHRHPRRAPRRQRQDARPAPRRRPTSAAVCCPARAGSTRSRCCSSAIRRCSRPFRTLFGRSVGYADRLPVIAAGSSDCEPRRLGCSCSGFSCCASPRAPCSRRWAQSSVYERRPATVR